MKNIVKLLSFITLLFVFPIIAQAYTTVSGDIDSTITWDGGTYYINADLNINNYGSLTINPGTVVKIAENVSVNVYGSLDIQGSSTDKVIITSKHDDTYGERISGSSGTVTSSNRWHNINLYSGERTSLWNVYIAHGEKCLYLGYNGNVSLYYSEINHCKEGVYAAVNASNRASISLTSSKIHNSSSNGIYASYAERVSVSRSEILNNGNYGISTKTSNYVSVYDSKVNGNGGGIYGSGNGETYVNNSTINHNGNTGITTSQVGSKVKITNSDISYNNHDGLSLTKGTYQNSLEFYGNTINYNGSYPVRTNYLDPAFEINSYVGNHNPYIYISGKSYDTSNRLYFPTEATIKNNGVGLYIAHENFTIYEGTTINVDPGVVFKFPYNSTTPRVINVRGTFNVNGTPTQKVVFTSVDDNSVGAPIGTGAPSPGKWGGIRLADTTSNNLNINHAYIAYAGVGVHSYYGRDFTIKNTEIKECSSSGIVNYGSSSKRASVTLDNVNSHHNGSHGFDSKYGNNISISNSSFNDNGDSGVESNDYESNINNSTFNNNLRHGIYLSNNKNTRNNIAYNNGRSGFYLKGYNTSITKYNLASSNDTSGSGFSNYKIVDGITDVPPDSTNLEGLAPNYVDEVDYEPSISSPMVDAGDPAFGTHPISGTIYDIGAKEFHKFVDKEVHAVVSNIAGRHLSYTWTLVEDPTGGSTPPELSITSGLVGDGNLSTSLLIKKLGTYKVKLDIYEDGQVVHSSIKTLNVTN